MLEQIVSLLGSEAEASLRHACRTIPKERLHLPGPDLLERVHAESDRNARVTRSLTAILNHGCLAETGYLSLRSSRTWNIPPVRRSRRSETSERRRGAARMPFRMCLWKRA